MRVWARGISVRRRVHEPDRPLARGDEGPVQVLLQDAWFHVRAGQLVGVLCDTPECPTTLLRVLAGSEPRHAGQLECTGRAVLLARIGEGLEAGLTVAENVAVFGAFLGASVAEARQRSAHVAELAGLGDRLETRLGELDAPSIAGLALAVALELASPELLLVDRMPPIPLGAPRDRLTARVWQLRQAGGAVVQVVSEPASLLAPADRMLWIADRAIVSSGHAGSVADACWRSRLGLAAPGGAAA
jgi:ABC-type polysaccharide/polyol phosphate transport system ATPase subunit